MSCLDLSNTGLTGHPISTLISSSKKLASLTPASTHEGFMQSLGEGWVILNVDLGIWMGAGAHALDPTKHTLLPLSC